MPPTPAATAFYLVWPGSAAAAVLGARQAWAPDAPDAVAASLLVRAGADPRPCPNFPDPELEDAPRACHGANLDRLRRVKAPHDPGNVFRFHGSVVPAT